MAQRILIIDDDPVLRLLLSEILKRSGFDPLTAADGTSGIAVTSSEKPDLVITDFQMPDLTGLQVVTELKQRFPGLPVIMLTAHGDVSLTIKAIQAGAFDFIEKPVNPAEILEAIKSGLKAAERSRNLEEAVAPSAKKSLDENLVVGKSAIMREIFKNIGRVSLNRVNVLISGEPGTGKERIARLVHYSSEARDLPFVSVNCSAISEEQLTRELFGQDAIRGSARSKSGKLMQAGKGTIFLNEISALSPGLQTMLQQLLEGMSSLKLSDGQEVFQARVVSSTSQDIEKLVQQGSFSKGLYYLLKVFSVHIPPLRERLEDIPELVQHILQSLNKSMNKKVSKLEDGVLDTLRDYHWPGNVRELKNTIMQAMILSPGDVLERKHIKLEPESQATGFPGSTEGRIFMGEDGPAAKASGAAQGEDVLMSPSGEIRSLADIEKEHIARVLAHTGWNKQESAALLGITRPTLNAKIDKYELIPPRR